MAEEEPEAVFEIADFSCRTAFERLCSVIEQKLWAWMSDEMSDQDEVRVGWRGVGKRKQGAGSNGQWLLTFQFRHPNRLAH